LLIGCTASSQCGGERSNPQTEARNGEPASRNDSELDSASLHQMRVAMLPNVLKPVAGGEETFTSNRRALRGDWRRRVGKDNSRNLRDPPRTKSSRRESDGPIVAKNGLTRPERRGPTVCMRRLASVQPLDKVDYGTNGRKLPMEANPACRRSIQESRMREICTSGSMRGSDGRGVACNGRPSLSTLLVQGSTLEH
jgi:hypothetical protein